ncbi:MAG: hypothetical protein QXV16_02090 [Candidatus Anstonellales archaeon]
MMEEYRSILENLKHKNTRGLEHLSNKYFKEFILNGDELFLKKSVIAKAFSYITDINYTGDPEELFYENIEFMNDAKEYIAIKLHNLGYTYSRISELLHIDIINIVNRLDLEEGTVILNNTIHLDQSAIAFIAKTNMLDLFDFLDLNVVTYIDSRDIRTRAIYRNNRIKLIDPENLQYKSPLYLSAKPLYLFSNRELGFAKMGEFYTLDMNLTKSIYSIKERIENYSNRVVMVDEQSLEQLSKMIVAKPLSYLITYAISKGYYIGDYDKTIYID